MKGTLGAGTVLLCLYCPWLNRSLFGVGFHRHYVNQIHTYIYAIESKGALEEVPWFLLDPKLLPLPPGHAWDQP